MPLRLCKTFLITSGPTARDDRPNGFLLWTTSNVWSNSGDPGRLLDAAGTIVAQTGG